MVSENKGTARRREAKCKIGVKSGNQGEAGGGGGGWNWDSAILTSSCSVCVCVCVCDLQVFLHTFVRPQLLFLHWPTTMTTTTGRKVWRSVGVSGGMIPRLHTVRLVINEVGPQNFTTVHQISRNTRDTSWACACMWKRFSRFEHEKTAELELEPHSGLDFWFLDVLWITWDLHVNLSNLPRLN